MDVSFREMTLKRREVSRKNSSGFAMCYACGICTSSCPVSMSAGILNPRRLVSYVNLGLYEKAIDDPAIWYCIGCRRCGNLCPNGVKPWMLIGFLKAEAVCRGVVGIDIWRNLFQLREELGRVLVNGVERYVLEKADLTEEFDSWERLVAGSPSGKRHAAFRPGDPITGDGSFNTLLCITCRECSSACPVSLSIETFDPLFFVRGGRLGMDAGMVPAAVWACIQCESCSRACSQSVEGHLLIRHYQEMIMTLEGFSFFKGVQQVRDNIFKAYVKKADEILAGG